MPRPAPLPLRGAARSAAAAAAAPPSASSSSSPARSQCSSCGAALPSVIDARCPSCTAFTPPPPSDGPPTHFELFGLAPAFAVDRADLKRRFLQWQQRVHPDTVRAGAEGPQAQWARDWSGRVNTAYKALDQPLPRAEYMVRWTLSEMRHRLADAEPPRQLALEGASVGEADQADDPALLMEILEIREALEEAETEEHVASIRSTNQGARRRICVAAGRKGLIRGRAPTDLVAATTVALQAAFETGDVQEAKRLSIKLRYYGNVEDVCREWQSGQPPPTLQH